MEHKMNKFEKVINKNMSIWKEELISHWRDNKYTDCSLDEYCAFKTWVLSMPKNYFEDLQSDIKKLENKSYSFETIKHDSWVMFLSELGFSEKTFLYRLYEKISDDIINFEEKDIN